MFQAVYQATFPLSTQLDQDTYALGSDGPRLYPLRRAADAGTR